MPSDIEQLAAYIARLPDAYALLASLEKQPLRLRYRAGNFSTKVSGNHFYVRSVTINFDPRSAAVLRSGAHCSTNIARCVASPADAFLHELLHAKIALLETKQFVSSGAMQAILYPHAHERDVISRERQMYAAMTRHDQQPRPLRQNHSGYLIAANCVTCAGG